MELSETQSLPAIQLPLPSNDRDSRSSPRWNSEKLCEG